MDIPLSLVTDSFAPPADGQLDFDTVSSPRALRPRPVGADASAEVSLRADLAWFWNSNPDWAEDQIALAESYEALARGYCRSLGLREGDRVILSASEPDDRRAAWRRAVPRGVEVSDWRPRRLGRVLLRDLETLLDERTRLVVLTKACPVTGSLNEVIPVAQLLERTNAVLVTEASHFVAHGSLDIRNLRCDAVIADGAELFGARGAARWVRRLGPAAPASSNGAISPNTLAGLARAVSYAERLGEAPSAPVAPPSERFGRREPMRKGMQSIRQEERILSRLMLRGLARIKGVSLIGEDDPRRAATRTPTFSFTCEGETAPALAEALRSGGVEVGFGDLGCVANLEALGLNPEAGVLRASLAHYHTRQDIERFLRALRSVL
jgi:selenocysteine lyase/cysteine desulfurase